MQETSLLTFLEGIRMSSKKVSQLVIHNPPLFFDVTGADKGSGKAC